MTSSENDPIHQYLAELHKELNHRATVSRDALCDANEFLQNEYRRLRELRPTISTAGAYSHFVNEFGTPQQVADGYAEPTAYDLPAKRVKSGHRRRVWKPAIAAALMVVSMVTLCVAGLLQEPPKLSPFTEVRIEGDKVIVRVRKKLYEFVSLDDIPTSKILRTAQDEYGQRWEKRFAEDLVEVLWKMEHRPKSTVKLQLRDVSTGKLQTIPDAAMTEENRRAVWNARNNTGEPADVRFTSEHTAALFAQFKAILHDRWSYYPYSATEVDHALDDLEKSLKELGERAPNAMNSVSLARRFQVVIAHGVDGHAEVTGRPVEAYYLPFLIEASGDRFVAFQPDRRGFLANGFPYITAMDGRPIAEWIEAAKALVPKGSPGYGIRHALRQIREVEARRREMALPTAVPLRVELESENGEAKSVGPLDFAPQLPVYGVWPLRESRRLEGGIGYLRIPSMDKNAVEEIKRRMNEFKGTNGLILDLRDNVGGSRDALRWFASYLMGDRDVPRVANCAKYRLYNGFTKDHLASRFMYRGDAPEWTDAERSAIARFQSTFKPKWHPPDKLFSDWHYMVLSRLDEPGIYHYTKPVVVLMNAKCFSATDVFLAALKGCSRVTLMGTPSGGGSARAEKYRIGDTPIHVRLGSMVSFMPSGELFDTHGVQPDVVIQPEPEYFVGRSDNTLEAAIDLISRKK